VRFQAEIAFVSILPECVNLFLPCDMASADRSPYRRMTKHVAILGMHVGDAMRWQESVAIGERRLSGNQAVSGIPDHLQVRAGNILQNAGGFGGSADVAGMLVLKADDQAFLLADVCQIGQRLGDGFATEFRLNGAPVGEDPYDARAEEVGELDGVFGQARLIFEGVPGRKDIVLEPAVQFRSVWENALEQRGSNGDNGDAGGGKIVARAGEFIGAEIHDVFAVNDAKFSRSHSDFQHDRDGFRKSRGKFVSDCGDGDLRLEGCHLYTCSMFFRRDIPKLPTFSDRINVLKKAGFTVETTADGRAKISKHGVAVMIGDEGKGQTTIEKSGVVMNGEIATLLSGGYQMFLETPTGKRYPAQAEQLKALHEFEMDVKDALELTDLYNTSLGTTSRNHMYDRVTKRDSGTQPKPWEKKVGLERIIR
jgi:hypothetical protein